MDKGVDTGEILEQIKIPIVSDETATTLYRKVNLAHINLMKKIWSKIVSNNLVAQRQDESKATYWDGRKPKDGEINPKTMTLEQIDRLVRATTKPYPGAFLINGNKKIIIWSGSKNKDTDGIKIPCKDGIYTLTHIEKIDLE